MNNILLKKTKDQTLSEEVVNALIHGIGTILGIFGFILLINHHEFHNDPKLAISLTIYGTTLILLYGVSMLYHAIPNHAQNIKAVFRIFDHSAIYLLIAGTYTPFTLVSIGGPLGWGLFIAIWTLAVIGLFYKACFFGRWPAFSVILYLCMGWLAIFAIKPVFQDFSLDALAWIFAGGAFYTFGVIFFIFDHKFHFFHALWHLCVLAGSACHFYAVLYYVKI